MNKWDGFIFEWMGWGVFRPDKFPIEYIMLIPRRVFRKVPVFGMLLDTDKGKDYALVFTFKTLANGLEDVNAIKESRIDYWQEPSNLKEKYSNALRYINNIISGRELYSGKFLIAYVRYVMNCYSMMDFRDDANIINYTIRTLKSYIKFVEENDSAKRDAWSELW